MKNKKLTVRTKSSYLRSRHGNTFELTIEGTDQEVFKKSWYKFRHTDNACMFYCLREKFENLPRKGIIYCCIINGERELLHESELR